ncbi:hypothetical protein AB0A98_22670 [Streptomyces chrestomyceticus]|uniref:hypothetical protein n=1 Tax=Streptomyces chrestomyceticus TaxID=68185 RepID=UPI0034091472
MNAHDAAVMATALASALRPWLVAWLARTAGEVQPAGRYATFDTGALRTTSCPAVLPRCRASAPAPLCQAVVGPSAAGADTVRHSLAGLRPSAAQRLHAASCARFGARSDLRGGRAQ